MVRSNNYLQSGIAEITEPLFAGSKLNRRKLAAKAEPAPPTLLCPRYQNDAFGDTRRREVPGWHLCRRQGKRVPILRFLSHGKFEIRLNERLGLLRCGPGIEAPGNTADQRTTQDNVDSLFYSADPPRRRA